MDMLRHRILKEPMTAARFQQFILDAEAAGIAYARNYVYHAYLGSTHWTVFRCSAIEAAGEKCQRCREYADPLEIHHLHYDTIGEESVGDVLVLCTQCHAAIDTQRTKGDRALLLHADWPLFD